MAHAAKFGRLDVIQALLEFGDKMDIRERDTIAAACNAGHEDVMCFLISNGLGTTSHRKVYILEHFARTHYSKALALLLQDPHFSTEYGEGNKVEVLEMYLFSNESNYEMVFLLLDAIHTKSTLEKTELVRRSLVRLLSGRLWGACATRNPAAASSKTLFILKVLEKLSSSSIEASGIIRQAARHNCFLDAIKLVLLSGHPWTLGHSEEERSKAMQGALDISLYCKSEKITQFLRDQGCKYWSINLCRAIRYKDLDLIKKVIDSGISVNCTFDFKDDELPVKLRDEEYDDDYDSDDYYYSDDYYSVDYYSDEDDIDSEDDIVCRINGIEETDETIEERARIIVEKRLHVLRTPLQEALYKFPYFLPAFKLLYLGADYTNVSEEAKDWLYKCLWRISFLSLIKQRDNNKSTKEPTRLSFAGVSCKLDENFPRKVEMLDAMARLVLGNEYIQKLQEYEEVWDKKYKVRFRSWEP
ncbi:hypothetical protein F5Y02DRAFT_412295 [Annulohypoxylon stygium]|nr:hypothetical protein F5Y02DRAFT_412295 [Annulohypoxylon stygium]